MSKVSLGASATGAATFDIVAPATNTNRVITLPDSSGQVSVLDLRTAVTASGTAVDFLNIPATARRVTVMFNGVSTNGTSPVQIQLGSGSVQTSGYVGAATLGTSSTTSSSGVPLFGGVAADIRTGVITFANITGNTWVASGAASSNDANSGTSIGRIGLSGPLDRLRITTVNGTDTFDAGTINIMVE